MMKNSVVLRMKPVCECGYVFEDLTLTKERIESKNKRMIIPLYSYKFTPKTCPKCGKEIDCVSTPLLGETDGVTIFAKKEENNAE